MMDSRVISNDGRWRRRFDFDMLLLGCGGLGDFLWRFSVDDLALLAAHLVVLGI